MKRVSLIMLYLFITNNLLLGQQQNYYEVNAGLAIPTGELATTRKIGFGFEGIGRFGTKNPTVTIAAGILYTALSEKIESEIAPTHPSSAETKSMDMLTFFSGVQLGKEKGAYFLPAITGNFYEGKNRFGVDIGGGMIFQFGSNKTKVDVKAKYSLTNLIGKDKLETSINIIHLTIGLIF